MIRCQNCHRPCQLYLCENCSTQLANMLSMMPWLIDELNARIQKLDRIGAGTIGRQRRPDEMNIMDFDAAETARKVRKKLLHWVDLIAYRHTGRKPPALDSVATQSLARWLENNTNAIARLDLAKKGRHELYDDIAHMVGTPTNPKGGQLVAAINNTERHFAGLCPTTTGHTPDGNAVECEEPLYADTDEHTIECPTCHQKIDVEANRIRAAKSRDLMTKTELVEVLTDAGEPVTLHQLNHWIRACRLRRKGWRHDGQLVEHRINSNSQPVYSLARARKLRGRDRTLKQLAKQR